MLVVIAAIVVAAKRTLEMFETRENHIHTHTEDRTQFGWRAHQIRTQTKITLGFAQLDVPFEANIM